MCQRQKKNGGRRDCRRGRQAGRAGRRLTAEELAEARATKIIVTKVTSQCKDDIIVTHDVNCVRPAAHVQLQIARPGTALVVDATDRSVDHTHSHTSEGHPTAISQTQTRITKPGLTRNSFVVVVVIVTKTAVNITRATIRGQHEILFRPIYFRLHRAHRTVAVVGGRVGMRWVRYVDGTN